MTDFVALDSNVHKNLKVIQQYGTQFGHNVNQALVFPTEFQTLHREYPIFFRQSEGQYYSVALLGLGKGENVFVRDGQWQARGIPGTIFCGPFSMQQSEVCHPGGEKPPIVMLNLQDKRVNTQQGTPVFKQHGGYSDYFDDVLATMTRLHKGAKVAPNFFAQLSKYDLIEQATVEVAVDSNTHYSLPNLYTISRERMANLSADELAQLNALGILEHCFFILSSIGNISYLSQCKASLMQAEQHQAIQV